MKHFPTLALVGAFSTLSAAAQPAPSLISPEIREDHSVTFRLQAPKSQSVVLRGQWDKEQVAMTLDADKVWTLTVPKITPGVWEYSFIVDGLTMIDPLNPAQKPQRKPTASILHVPGTPAAERVGLPERAARHRASA